MVASYLASTSVALAEPYETVEFGDPKSRVPTVMLCAFAGEKLAKTQMQLNWSLKPF